MHEIEVGKTRIEFNDLATSRDGLASLLGEDCAESTTLARISNGVCRAAICLNNRPQTRSFYPSGSLTLENYSKHSGALFAIEREFNQLKELIYKETQKRLKENKIDSSLDGSGLHLFNGASLFGTGTLNYYICNEYIWPEPPQVDSGIDLLCYEVALCSICTALFYDMANLVVMDNKAIAGNVMYERFDSYLHLDVNAARLQLKDDVLTEDLRRSMEEAVRLTHEADDTLMAKMDALKRNDLHLKKERVK